MATDLARLARTLKSLHEPGNPIVFANVYDAISAEAVASLPSSAALATASYAVARAHGLEDDDLTLELNLAAAQAIGKVAAKHDKPFTVDIQDGYGKRLEEAIRKIIDCGVVGVNLEDYDREDGLFRPEEAVERIKTVLAVAEEKGVPYFVVNARCDVLVHGGSLEDVIARGKKYLDAGATSVFVWGGSKRGGVSRAEVQELVGSFEGRLNVILKLGSSDGLTVKELSQLGVSRISVGPQIQLAAMDKLGEIARNLLDGKQS